MKSLLAITLTLSALAVSLSAGAASLGTRGGGNSIDVNGRPTLRDLIDKSVCSWMSGKDVLHDEPYLESVLTSLGQVHFSFRELLRNETLVLNYCFTEGTLNRVNTEDAKGLTILEGPSGDQVAVRVEDRVYIDKKIFRAMDDKSRAFLVIHEVMHSFIPWGVEHRNNKLRSMVRYLSEMQFSPEKVDSLLLQIRMNDVQMPSTPQTLEQMNSVAAKLQKATGADTSLEDRLQTYSELESLLTTPGGRFYQSLRGAEVGALAKGPFAVFINYPRLKDLTPDLRRVFAALHTDSMRALSVADLTWLMDNVPNDLFEVMTERYGEYMDLNRYVTFNIECDDHAKQAVATGLVVAAIPLIMPVCLLANATVGGLDMDGSLPDLQKRWQEVYPMYFIALFEAQPQNAVLYAQNLTSLLRSKAIDPNAEAYMKEKDFKNKRNGLSLDVARRRYRQSAKVRKAPESN